MVEDRRLELGMSPSLQTGSAQEMEMPAIAQEMSKEEESEPVCMPLLKYYVSCYVRPV